MNNTTMSDDYFTVSEIIKLINRGIIQVPEFMSEKFNWGETEILSMLEHYYSGLYSPNVLLISGGSEINPCLEYEIPARRLSRNISKIGITHPENKPVKKPAYDCIYYIVDGYHRLQSLYLAWNGMFNRKYVYFNESALNSPRFCFLTAAENKTKKNCHRLSKAQDIFIENPVAFMDQVNKNCRWLKKIFSESSIIHTNLIDMNDALFNEHFFATFSYNPQMKTISDRLNFIRDNYRHPALTS